MRIVFGIFLILHGLVHLLYFALSRKFFELDPPLVGWPEQSWVFSNLLGVATTRSLASVLYIVVTILFVVSGLSVLLNANWWNPITVIAAIFSSAIVVLFWDGGIQRLPDKGFIGVLINVGILVVVFLVDRLVIAL